MHFSARVVPFDGKPAISFAIPIARTLIILLYCVQEVLRIFLADVFYFEIVYDKRELDGARLVQPQSRRCLALCVAMISQAIYQEFLCYYPCLWETIHSLLGLTIYEAAIFRRLISCSCYNLASRDPGTLHVLAWRCQCMPTLLLEKCSLIMSVCCILRGELHLRPRPARCNWVVPRGDARLTAVAVIGKASWETAH